MPNCKEEKEIEGNIEISSDSTKPGKVIIPVKSKIAIPKLVCEKMIKLKRFEMPVIKLYLKNLKRQDFRIALKNNSAYNCFGDLSVMKNPSLEKQIEINFYPNQISMQANGANNFMMGVKCSAENEEQIAN